MYGENMKSPFFLRVFEDLQSQQDPKSGVTEGSHGKLNSVQTVKNGQDPACIAANSDADVNPGSSHFSDTQSTDNDKSSSTDSSKKDHTQGETCDSDKSSQDPSVNNKGNNSETVNHKVKNLKCSEDVSCASVSDLQQKDESSRQNLHKESDLQLDYREYQDMYSRNGYVRSV